MPRRKTVLASGQYYHIYNRGNARQPTFLNANNYRRFIKTLDYYQYASPPLRLSKFLLLSKDLRNQMIENVVKGFDQLVKIICFCLMPNHFHLMLYQNCDHGISKYMAKLQNSYTRYFNTKRQNTGAVFQGYFKAVRIETDEQLLHLGRYIHLNPFSGYVVNSLHDLRTYPWSSLSEYLNEDQSLFPFLDKKVISDFFKDSREHREFIFDEADHQRRLQEIKHLVIEDP